MPPSILFHSCVSLLTACFGFLPLCRTVTCDWQVHPLPPLLLLFKFCQAWSSDQSPLRLAAWCGSGSGHGSRFFLGVCRVVRITENQMPLSTPFCRAPNLCLTGWPSSSSSSVWSTLLSALRVTSQATEAKLQGSFLVSCGFQAPYTSITSLLVGSAMGHPTRQESIELAWVGTGVFSLPAALQPCPSYQTAQWA